MRSKEYSRKVSTEPSADAGGAYPCSTAYTANSLNQYTSIANSALSASPRETCTPTYDDDGNQTLIKTSTGIWSVTYNGENRPVLWENFSTNSPTHNSSTPPLISMSYDRMGRRVTKNDQRFVYNGYLQIANFEHQTSNIKLQTFIWDQTEPVATRPLAWNSSTFQPFNSSTSYYTHDGNKNVSEVITVDGSLAAHYEYAPFGAVTAQCGTSVADNPWRFSSEYAEDDTATVYYNYRHYEPVMGRWMSRDPIGGKIEIMIYGYLRNRPTDKRDFIGLFDDGGYVCLEKQGVYEYVPSVGFVYKEVCVAWEYKKGHKDFPNNGTNCPFDYTAEDNSIWTSPFTPWGLWRHFRSMEDVISDIFDLLEKPRCDAKRFQSLMHQLQDFFTHYNRSGEVFSCEIKWRWYTLGHLLGGTAPDLDDFAQGDAFDDAKTMTEYMLKIWHDNCILCSTAPCEWKPNPARKTGSGNMPSAPDLKTWKPESK